MNNGIVLDLVDDQSLFTALANEDILLEEFEILLANISDELRILLREYSYQTNGEYFSLSKEVVSKYEFLYGLITYEDGVSTRYTSSWLAEIYFRMQLASLLIDSVGDETMDEVRFRLLFLDTYLLENEAKDTLYTFDLVDQYFRLLAYSPPQIMSSILASPASDWQYTPTFSVYNFSDTNIPLVR